MAAATEMRKSRSINDYPEHLNPFREDDNHRGIRFWTLSRKSGRNNNSTFSLNNIKDFRNTWSLKSFMRKNKKGQETSEESKPKATVNGDSSPVQFRRAMQGRSSERYVYGGSVTPLPRSRFPERARTATSALNHTSPNNFTHMTPGRSSFSHRSGEACPPLSRDAAGSRTSVATVGSLNPFDDSPQPPLRRKKKRAPLPPSLDTSQASSNISTTSAAEETKKTDEDVIDDPSLNIELKIVEEIDEKPKSPVSKEAPPKIEVTDASEQKSKDVSEVIDSPKKSKEVVLTTVNSDETDAKNNNVQKGSTSTPNSPIELRNKKQDSTDSDGKDVVFEKVNIRLYRRNSSLSSDIDKKNGNIELNQNSKRSKSLANNVNVTFAYDIPLHIDEVTSEAKDLNDNQTAPQKVVCKLLNTNNPRKGSADNSISSTEREFIEIDRATRELEQEISKLNSFGYIDDVESPRKSNGNSVSEIKSRFENSAMHSPNPIPKPRRSPRAGSVSPIN